MSEWNYKIDLGRPFNPDQDDFSEHRDRVVAVIRNSRWARWSQYSLELRELLGDLAVFQEIEAFDEAMTAIYDLADEDLCWIGSDPW